ncbi:hypothetical protein LCL95_09570 [Bacillus timonensis]|nr:hypothetical protein [Bacillus timonensis]
MNNKWYVLYFFIIGVISFFTQEIVTFVMLSFILISLNNINTNLKKMNDNLEKLKA